MGKTVAEVFGTEKNSALAAAEIFAMRIDMENRTVEAKIAPAKTVHKSEIYTLQSKICEKLGIQNVRLVPVYSPSLLGDDYFGDIAAEAARRGVPVNGFFNGCSAHFGDGKLEIELAHGGVDILLRERCDKVMQQIIREEFGVSVEVVFSGVTEVDPDSVKIEPPPLRTAAAAYPAPAPRIVSSISTESFDTADLPIDTSEMKTVMGKPIRERPMRLADVNMQSSRELNI